MANRKGRSISSGRFYFLELQYHCGWWLQPWNFFPPWKESYNKPRQHIKILKSKDITLPTKVCIIMVFPVVMYRCQSWTIRKGEHQRIDAFELWCWRRLENPLDCKEIKQVSSKGNQPWIFIERIDAEAGAPVILPSNVKSWLIEKDPDAGKDWR